MELGSSERTIIKQAVRAGDELPDRIKNAPQLRLGLELYLDAFFDLDSERTHALAVTPIAWSSIAKYAEFYSFDETQTEDLFFFIRGLDNTHLEKLEHKRKANEPKK